MARVRVLVLGGTFDRLHIGHEALLNTAFRRGERVGIGLTTADFLRGRAKPLGELIRPYAQRRRELTRWLRRHHPGRDWWIAPLDDPLGRSVDPRVDAIVVSADTAGGGRAVNRERRRRGLAPVAIYSVPLVLADDLKPVSSRRVRAGIIDREGRRLSSILVRARSPRRARAPLRAALKTVYRTPSIRWADLGDPSSASGPRRQKRRPAEIDIVVRSLSRNEHTWSVRVRAGRIRLPATPIEAGTPGALAAGIVYKLHPAPPRARARARSAPAYNH